MLSLLLNLDSNGEILYNREERQAIMGLHFLQTMRLSFEEICEGQNPWIPLGKFMHDWYELQRDRREELVADPLPVTYPQEFHQWAAFCAASVRWFCATYELLCPSWVDRPEYVLPEPWCADKISSSWESERETTAPEFTRHNIYCGNVVYTNKYERDDRGWPLRSHPVDLQERIAVVRRASERLARTWEEEERQYQEYLPTALAQRAAAQKRKLTMRQ